MDVKGKCIYISALWLAHVFDISFSFMSDNVKPTHTHANKHTHPPVDNSIN